MTKHLTKNKNKGRFLTLILRHKPEEIGLKLDEGGWGDVKYILEHLDMNMKQLDKIVDNDNKNRFGYNSDKTKIRANQGHSINVDLGMVNQRPPKFLYHGTVEKYMPWIQKEGLKKMSRHHVHLSGDLDTATQVASRRNTDNVLLEIRAEEMFDKGFEFFQSENGVWLTDGVPYEYTKRI